MADQSGYRIEMAGRALLLVDHEAEALALTATEGAEIVRRRDGRRLYRYAGGAWLYTGNDAQPVSFVDIDGGRRA